MSVHVFFKTMTLVDIYVFGTGLMVDWLMSKGTTVVQASGSQALHVSDVESCKLPATLRRSDNASICQPAAIFGCCGGIVWSGC